MKIYLKSVLFALSLVVNAVFISLFILSSFTKITSINYYSPGEDYIAAATIVNFPISGEIVFEEFSITLKPGDKATLQYLFVQDNNQFNFSFTPLFDPNVISVLQTKYGLEITALYEGETLMQTLTNNGIQNLAFVTVIK